MSEKAEGQWIITGTNDPKGTVGRMRSLIRRDAVNPNSILAANSIVMTADGHDSFAMAQQILQWAAQHFHFIPDVDEMQVLKSPSYLLHEAQSKGIVVGNCADAAMLTAMLAIANGIPCTLEARAFINPTAPYQHVVAIANTNRGNVDFDITRPVGSPNYFISRRYDLKV